MAIVAYVVPVREIELGWGDRPDGYLLGIEKDNIQDFVNKSEAFKKDSKEYSEVVGSPRLCQITEETSKRLSESETGAIWLMNNKAYNESVIKD